MKIRITGGDLRGRVILSPELAGTHPMGAREKIALFNMIGNVQGWRVLDAYAGSGALGIEALSRGATEVVFVEQNTQATQVIRENLADLGLTELGEVVHQSVGRFLTEQGAKGSQELRGGDASPSQQFDLILADPPYDDFDSTEVAELGQMLTPEGILLLSHPKITDSMDGVPEVSGLKLLKTHAYARANLSLYAKLA